MTVKAADLARVLHATLDATALEVLDESAAHAGHAGAGPHPYGTHFRIRIASPRFAGLSRVAQHRLVYDPLRPMIDRGVHAIAIEVLPSAQAAGTDAASQASPPKPLEETP